MSTSNDQVMAVFTCEIYVSISYSIFIFILLKFLYSLFIDRVILVLETKYSTISWSRSKSVSYSVPRGQTLPSRLELQQSTTIWFRSMKLFTCKLFEIKHRVGSYHAMALRKYHDVSYNTLNDKNIIRLARIHELDQFYLGLKGLP